MHSVRALLVDSPTSVGARARLRRWDLFHSHFPDIGDMRVLDLGGTVESWVRAPLRPAHVTVLNLTEPGWSSDGWITPVAGDACAARASLHAAGALGTYDLVFSNSLLEHVGGHAQRSRFAQSARGLAPYHWIQTPYRYFPVEPHWLFPLMQFLPVGMRAVVAERWPLGHSLPASRAEALSNVLWTELISITELRAYFPDSRVLKERLLGLTKSIVAVSSPT